VPSLLAAAESDDAAVRTSAMAALGQLARPEQAPQMLDAVLKAKKGPEREAAEKAVMFVCNRIEDPDKRADGLLAALAGRSADEQIVLLSTVGRVGGAPARKLIEAAMAGPDAKRREAAFRALCNWPDAGVAAKLADLVRTGADAEHRTAALRALIRVAALADKRSDADRLELLKKCLGMATRDEERLLVIRRARAVRTVETLRFVLPYLEQPAFAQEACATVVELAHHRNLREPNKAEFDPALDAVIRICKDPKLIDRAKRYKKGQTL
jgi:hypothetical protein